MSPPVRGRGLKHFGLSVQVVALVSPPVRGRGLKQERVNALTGEIPVAPRAGARIETQLLP